MKVKDCFECAWYVLAKATEWKTRVLKAVSSGICFWTADYISSAQHNKCGYYTYLRRLIAIARHVERIMKDERRKYGTG